MKIGILSYERAVCYVVCVQFRSINAFEVCFDKACIYINSYTRKIINTIMWCIYVYTRMNMCMR